MAEVTTKDGAGSDEDDESEPDPEGVLRAIHRRAADIERRELAYGLSQLEARGGRTDRQERVLSELADALVAEILSGPESVLADAEKVDNQTLRAAMDVFGGEQSRD